MTKNQKQDFEKGSILLLVVWVIAILAIIASLFAVRAKVSVKNAMYLKMKTEGYITLSGAIQRAIYDILVKPAVSDTKELDKNRVFFDYQIDGIEVRVKKIPVSAKLSIQQVRLDIWKKIFMSYAKEEDEAMAIIASIQDWVDKDGLVRIDGAEDDYYQSLDFPYYPKNNKIEDLKELLLIKGIDEEMFYGSDRFPPLTDFFTIYNDGGKLDINTVSKLVLISLLGIDEETANAIILKRNEQPFTNMNELTDFLDETEYLEAAKYFTVNPRDDKIILEASFKNGKLKTVLSETYEIKSNSVKLLERVQWAY
jgi:general secretion pathway protein K